MDIGKERAERVVRTSGNREIYEWGSLRTKKSERENFQVQEGQSPENE